MVRKHHRDATLQGDLKALKMELGTRAWARNAGRRSSRDRPTTRRSPAEPSACGPKLERTVRATASDGPPAVDQIISGAIMARSTGRAAIRRDVDLAGLPRHFPAIWPAAPAALRAPKRKAARQRPCSSWRSRPGRSESRGPDPKMHSRLMRVGVAGFGGIIWRSCCAMLGMPADQRSRQRCRGPSRQRRPPNAILVRHLVEARR
jgi:hypothetical protein